jgi:hypothetical protein
LFSKPRFVFNGKSFVHLVMLKKIVADRAYRVSQDLRPLLQDFIPEVVVRQKYCIHTTVGLTAVADL